MQMEYSYIAQNFSGEVFHGELRADTKREAARHIQEQGLYIKKLKPAVKPIVLKNASLWYTKRMKYIALFFRQLAVMNEAGVSLHDSLKILMEQEQEKTAAGYP